MQKAKLAYAYILLMVNPTEAKPQHFRNQAEPGYEYKGGSTSPDASCNTSITHTSY